MRSRREPTAALAALAITALVALTARASVAEKPAALVRPPPGAARASGSPSVPSSRCVTVLATTDLHGAFEPQVHHEGDRMVRVGGLPVLATYVQRLREQAHGRLLLVDSGDLYQGSVVSNLSEGRAVLALMNALGYDASVLGNHEFDFGEGSTHDGVLGVVRARVAEARFPFLVANVLDRATGRPVAWGNTRASVLIERGGIRVGIIGISNPRTPYLTRPQNVASLDFVDPVKVVTDAARELRSAGAELVVLLAHLGLEGGCAAGPEPVDCGHPRGALVELVERLPVGTLDLALGGHSHQSGFAWVGDVAVVQPAARARSLGRVEACIKSGGGLDRSTSRLDPPLPLCLDAWSDGSCGAHPAPGPPRPATFLGAPVAPSPEVTTLLAPFEAEVREQATRRIGATLPRALTVRAKDGSSPLGEVVLEAMRRAAGVELAIQNYSSLRATLPAGELTYADAFEAVPFDNRLVVLTLDGTQLRAMLAHLQAHSIGGPLVAGLRTHEEHGRLVVELADGAPLRPDGSYEVVTNDYLAQGGDGLAPILAGVPPERMVIREQDVRAAVIDYLRWRYPTKR